MDDLEESLRLGLEGGFAMETALAYVNLASWVWVFRGPAAGLEVATTGIEFSMRRGVPGVANWARGETTWMLFDLGRWDDVLAMAVDYAPRAAAPQITLIASTQVARVLFYRDRVDEAANLMERILPRARESGDPQVLFPALEVGAAIWTDLALVEELIAAMAVGQDLSADERLEAVWACRAANEPDLAERVVAHAESSIVTRVQHSLATTRAVVAELRGEIEEAATLFESAAGRWREFGFMLEEGRARLGHGRCLVALGQSAEATAPLERASALFLQLGASSLRREADELLREAA
jgi:tetratricopeptide (TPR) repeat protein